MAGMIYVAGSAGVTVLGPDLGVVGPVAAVEELLFLIAEPTGTHLFGVSGVARGWAHVWKIDGDAITAIGEPVATGGAEPCHCVLSRDGRHLVVTNYGTGSIAVLPIAEDGTLGAATVLTRSARPGPDRARQDGSHVHQAVLGPQDEVLVTDLGADEVISYRLVDGRLVDPVVSATPPGAGPRHLVLLPDDRVAVSGELDSTLLLARRDGRQIVDWWPVPATGRELTGRNYPSDLLVSTDSTTLYLANRGADTVAVFTADGVPVTEFDCGAWPRQMSLGATRLFVAATHADRIDVIDPTGRLERQVLIAGAICVVETKEKT